MSIEITVPSAGESVSSGILASWLKEDGAAVTKGDELFELETDKATLAVPAPASGVLKHGVKEGTEVQVGSVVGRIETDGRVEQSGDAPKADHASQSANGAAPVQTAPGQAADASGIAGRTAASAPLSAPAAVSGGGASQGASVLSPAVRRVVEENKLDPAGISGTGKGGRITKGDALQAAAGASPEPKAGGAVAPASSPESKSGERRQERVPMSMIRRTIAEHLVHGKQEAAHLTTFNEIDMSAVMALRSQYRDAFESRYGIKLGFMSFFVKACCETLKEFPEINAFLEGNEIVYNRYYDIGVAVSSDRGLVVPVLRDADRLGFSAIEQRVSDMAARVRDKKITVDELTGGTFTITNGGVFGSLLSTPIPNFPQSAILGMHTIQRRPVALGEQVVIRPMMYVALTYDHRIVDGRGAVSFLVRIKQYIENPERMLLEV